MVFNFFWISFGEIGLDKSPTAFTTDVVLFTTSMTVLAYLSRFTVRKFHLSIMQHRFANETGLSEPVKEVQINIDQVKKKQEVAEITETDEFKMLEQQAEIIRKTTENNSEFQVDPQTPEHLPSSETGVGKPLEKVEININKFDRDEEVAQTVEDIIKKPEFQELIDIAEEIRETNENNELQFEPQTPEDSTSSGETPSVQPAESVVVAPELESEAKTPAPLDSQSLEHCQQELSRCIELLARVIPLASAQSSPVPPTVLQPAIQQVNPTLPVTECKTQVQQVTAYLIHVQTARQIELPQNISIICIGRPNTSRSPDVDVSDFPNSEVVSRFHAVIYVEADRFYIEDVGSTNGTYINNLLLSPGERSRIEPGNYISLGKKDLVKFLFKVF